MVRTDIERDPWYSPAGYNRGQIKNVIKLPYNPGKTDRDQLTDFFDVYRFEQALVNDYVIDTDVAFKRALPPKPASGEA
jgi:hypothetical protein